MSPTIETFVPKPPSQKRTTGAARWFTNQVFGGPTRERETNPTMTTTVSILVPANPDRVGLVICNDGTVDIFWSLTNSVSSTNGQRVSGNGGTVTMTVRDDFTLVSREIDGIASSGTASCYVLEIIQDNLTEMFG